MVYFIFNPENIKADVHIFDNKGALIGRMVLTHAVNVYKGKWLASTFKRINLIRKMNGMKKVNL